MILTPWTCFLCFRKRDAVGNLVTSLSITNYAADLNLLSEPLIPFPDEVFLQPDPALLLELPQTYPGFQPPQEPVPWVDPPLAVLSRQGSLDVRRILPMWTRRLGPRFQECVGAPESARLLGRPPAEWLQVMDSRDVLIAAMQLQRDAGLMTSNLTVLN